MDLTKLLSPELISAVKDNFGVIALAMVLLAIGGWALLRDAPVIVRMGVFAVLAVIYSGVILIALDQNSSGAAKAESKVPSSDKPNDSKMADNPPAPMDCSSLNIENEGWKKCIEM